MKNIKLKSLLPLVLVLVLLASTTNYAYTYGSFLFDKKPNFPITYVAYYVDSSVSGYADTIAAAFNSWKVATKGNSANARIGYFKAPGLGFQYYPYVPQIVFKKSTTGKSYTAYLDKYGSPANSGTGEPFSNWSSCIIYLATPLSSPGFTITHEIGHVFRLIHPNSVIPADAYKGEPSCMIPSNTTTYASSRRSTPTSFDAGNINSAFK